MLLPIATAWFLLAQSVAPPSLEELLARAAAYVERFNATFAKVVAEERYELSDRSAMSVHQVRIELPEDVDAERVVVLAEHWAQACIADRHAELTDPI